MKLRCIQDVSSLKGKKILLRLDLNVPIRDMGTIVDDWRIDQSLPTIQYLQKKGAKIMVLSHLGRPHGRTVSRYRMDDIAALLSRRLKSPVQMVLESVGPMVERAAAKMKDGEIIVLENVRFHRGEEADDTRFARMLASVADIYVNDAFSNSHRNHASMVAITNFLPSYAGLLLQHEFSTLEPIRRNPQRPYTVIIGGVKIGSKSAALDGFLHRADHVLLGGGLSNTFLFAKGYNIGRSILNADAAADIKSFLMSKKLHLPVDAMISRSKSRHAKAFQYKIEDVPPQTEILDIGPETLSQYVELILCSKTILWAGPVGKFEADSFSLGTQAIISAIIKSHAYSIAGGGETLAAIDRFALRKDFSYLSTGGGALLQFLSGQSLPALQPLLI